MKTISVPELKSLVARKDWHHEQNHEVVERLDRQTEEYDHESESVTEVDIPHVWGVATVTSTLDDIAITYTEGFNYDECNPESLTTGTDGQDEVWSIVGVVVVNEDGDKLSTNEIADYLTDNFSSVDYSVLDIEQAVDVDADIENKPTQDEEMETFTLENDNAPSMRFSGQLIAHVSSTDNQANSSRYSGQTGRWTELSLYKTQGGKFVCHQIGRTIWDGERDRFSGKVCVTLSEIKDFFGHRWLAKDLYSIADIEGAIEVDGAKFAPVLAVVRRSLENQDPKAWEVCVVGKFPLDYAQEQMERYVNQGPMEDYYAVAEYSATGVRLIGDEAEGINEI